MIETSSASVPTRPKMPDSIQAVVSDLSLSVSLLTEEQLIGRVVASLGDSAPPFPRGPGSDCSHLDATPPNGMKVRVSTIDSVILGRHFDASTTTGQRAGRKLINRNLSDIAAAGAIPSDALLAFTMGRDISLTWFEDFCRGAGKAALKVGLDLVGGDIAKGPDGLFVATLAVTGFARRTLTRKTCRDGDVIFVTGRLGGSLAGHHLDFEPRLAEGKWLCEWQGGVAVTACTDISDGSAKDLPGLIGDQFNAVVDLDRIPISDAAKEMAAQVPGDESAGALQRAFTDGEDYELLFTVKSDQGDRLESEFKAAFPLTELTRIGIVVKADSGSGGKIIDSKTNNILTWRGYGHFA